MKHTIDPIAYTVTLGESLHARSKSVLRQDFSFRHQAKEESDKCFWFKQSLFTWHHSTFVTEYNKLHNKPDGLYEHSSNIKHTKLQT